MVAPGILVPLVEVRILLPQLFPSVEKVNKSPGDEYLGEIESRQHKRVSGLDPDKIMQRNQEIREQ